MSNDKNITTPTRSAVVAALIAAPLLAAVLAEAPASATDAKATSHPLSNEEAKRDFADFERGVGPSDVAVDQSSQ